MRFQLVVQRRALQELGQAKKFYKTANPDLAQKFDDVVSDALSKILDTPYGSDIVRGTLRQFNLKPFSYALLYAVEIQSEQDAVIVITSCIHQRSNPENWPETPK